MQHDKNDELEQKSTTDPQKDEKDGNILGPALDKMFGDAEGGNSLGEEEANDPDKQESIKTD